MDAAGLERSDREGELGEERWRVFRPMLFELLDREILPRPFVAGGVGSEGMTGGARERVIRESTSRRLMISIRRDFSLRSWASEV